MNSEQRQQIRGMVKIFSGTSTESLIAFVAETDSMLAACQALLHSLDATGSVSTEWLQRECSEEDVIFHEFLEELTKIVALFQTSRDVEDHYAILGVSADASLDEIKQAYRTLSRRYHPDTALPTYRDNPEKFIIITKAYQALLSVNTNDQQGQHIQQENQWRRKKERTITPAQRKKVFIWALGLLVVFMVASIIASMNFKKRAMLAGLKESRGAFIPPARKISEASTGKGINIDHHPTEQQPMSSATTKTPVHDLVAKVEQKPEADFLNVQVQEALRKETDNGVAAQASIAGERSPVKQLVEVQPNRAKEKTQAANAAQPSVQDTTAIPKSSENVDNHSSRQHVGVNGKAEIKGGREIALASEDNDAIKQTIATARKATQPTNTEKKLSVPGERAEIIEPVATFNSMVTAQPFTLAGGTTESEVKQTPATATEVVPFQAETSFQIENPNLEKPDMRTRVDGFLADYIKAYEQRNLSLFSRFFGTDAEENGKPFTTAHPTYVHLFAVTNHVSLQVNERTWRLIDGAVAVDGRFTVNLQYKDGRIINGSGPIGFILVDNNGELRIKKMQYVFHTK